MRGLARKLLLNLFYTHLQYLNKYRIKFIIFNNETNFT